MDKKDVRMNKFGGSERVSVSNGRGAASSQTNQLGKRNISESRSNYSLSITRRKQEHGGAASDTLNKLVRNSVQNLSKILHSRPSTNQERHVAVLGDGLFYNQDDDSLEGSNLGIEGRRVLKSASR